MVDTLDLYQVLSKIPDGSLRGIDVFGRVERPLPQPVNLTLNILTGVFAEVDVFGIRINSTYKHHFTELGIHSSDGIYMLNGKLITYFDSMPSYGVYHLTGTLRTGAKVFDRNSYVCLFNFVKQGNVWDLQSTPYTDIDLGVFTKGSRVYKHMQESLVTDMIIRPSDIVQHPAFLSIAPEPFSIVNAVRFIGGVQQAKPLIEQEVVLPAIDLSLLKGVLSRSDSDLCAFIDSLRAGYSYDEDIVNSHINYMLAGISRHLKVKSNITSVTGRVLLSDYLSLFNASGLSYLGTTVSGYIVNNFEELVLNGGVCTSTVPLTGAALGVYTEAFSDLEKFYACIVGKLTGVPRGIMLMAYDTCKSNGLSIVRVLNENPYLMLFLSDISAQRVEGLAVAFGRHNDGSLEKYRSICQLHGYIQDSNISGGSTVFTMDMLLGAGITLRATELTNIRSTGTTISSKRLKDIEAFIHNRKIEPYISKFDNNGRCLIKPSVLPEAVGSYLASGLGVMMGSYVTSSELARKEVYVYERFQELCIGVFDYPRGRIDGLIDDYENSVGFKLEQAQRDAVHLLVNSCCAVTGSAGSGKTTVSNCMVYVLRHLERGINIKFSAPTGKSAKRMQEVVHEEVKTAHSLFRVGGDTANIFSEEQVTDKFCNTVFFFDEVAMFTLDLMYQVLRGIDTNNCRVYLFGDINQLPPIGKGMPFRDLLSSIPSVRLTVVKRQAEGSRITYNSNLINCNSDVGCWRDLVYGSDFNLIRCTEADIAGNVVSLVENLINEGIGKDDIQVVTPISKGSYTWGTVQLNRALAPVFNPNRSYGNSFVINDVVYAVGDRVVHTKNMYGMQWYDSSFRKVYGNGVSNGEVGTIVGFVSSSDISILDEAEEPPMGYEYPSHIRDDRTWCGYFIVVRYYDYISDRDFYILYRAVENPSAGSNLGITFFSEDTDCFSMFYAGTVHKLQGSQYRVVIFAIGYVSYSGFITRQLLYTAVTRGSEQVYIVGVEGMINRARKDISSSNIRTVGEVLCG